MIADVGIGLTAVGAAHFVAAEAEEFLRGRAPSAEALDRAGEIAAEHCNPASDQRGPAEYKRHLVRELTARVLRTAVARAGGPAHAPVLFPSPGRSPFPVAMKITVTVNGTDHARVVEPRLLLIHFLRDDLGLTGSHWGCDTSNCGACVVWLDETPVKSCTVLAVMADGHRVTTVEGLAKHGALDPVQQAFAECHGLQCGFCTPGMMLTARWLLDNNPDPTAAEVREAISGQVCRCTGYENIVRSVLRPPSTVFPSTRGQAPMSEAYGSLPRKEDARFIRGQGRYVDDIALPGMLHGAILRSPLAHARVLSVDASAALAHPAVVAVLTGADLAERGLAWMPTVFGDTQAVLVTDKVRFQGQEVAFVVATDRYAARDALELIAVDYEPLPPLIDATTALDPPARRSSGRTNRMATASSTGPRATRRPPTRCSPRRTWWSAAT